MSAHTPGPWRCAFCGANLYDAREESGFTGVGPDWCAEGDYGCEYNPCSNEEGCGGHRTPGEVRMLARLAELEGFASFERVRDVMYGDGPKPGAHMPLPPSGSLLDSVLDMIALAAAAHGPDHPLVRKAQAALGPARPDPVRKLVEALAQCEDALADYEAAAGDPLGTARRAAIAAIGEAVGVEDGSGNRVSRV